jgi:hypothetical protein
MYTCNAALQIIIFSSLFVQFVPEERDIPGLRYCESKHDGHDKACFE